MMSDTVLKLIAPNPGWQPTAPQSNAAVAFLSRLYRDVSVHYFGEISFIDAGNWGGVCCPRCKADAEAWWSDAMTLAATSQFQDLRVTTPCCATATTLNDLIYRPPAGFASFAIDIPDPGAPLPTHIHRKLEQLLGAEIREIWFHV